MPCETTTFPLTEKEPVVSALKTPEPLAAPAAVIVRFPLMAAAVCGFANPAQNVKVPVKDGKLTVKFPNDCTLLTAVVVEVEALDKLRFEVVFQVAKGIG